MGILYVAGNEVGLGVGHMQIVYQPDAGEFWRIGVAARGRARLENV